MKKLAELINKIFGWGIYICLFAGGISFFGFLFALLVGGGEDGIGQSIAVMLHKQYFPIVIRIASIVIILGLIGMYLSGQKALSMTSDKEAADMDITLAKDMNKE